MRVRIPITTSPCSSNRCQTDWVELDRLARLRVGMMNETGAFLDAMPYPDTALQERTPLMHEIRRDGVDL